MKDQRRDKDGHPLIVGDRVTGEFGAGTIRKTASDPWLCWVKWDNRPETRERWDSLRLVIL